MDKKTFNKLKDLRQKLHQHAETAHQEKQTAKIICDFIKKTKPDDLEKNIGGHGILVTYKSNKKGKTLLFRAELDALPIPETNDISYRSINENNGHKCGHDGHMAILCGLALQLEKRNFSGKVYLLFQPAEETGEGAQKMLKDERMQDLNVDYGFALHNLPEFKKGQLILKANTFAAASTGIVFRLKGKPSHASHPKDGINPTLAATQIIQLFYEVPQMHTAIDETALITPIGTRIGQKAFGTSASEGELYATIRAFSSKTLKNISEILIAKAKAIAEAHQLEFESSYTERFEAVENDDKAYQLLKSATSRMDQQEVNKVFPWSEDFGQFSRQFPSCFFGLGAGKSHAQLHNEDYDFPDEIIKNGVKAFYAIIQN